jgi:hypothetical protein
MDNRDFIRKMMDAVEESSSVGEKQMLDEAQINISVDGPVADEFLARLMDLSGRPMASAMMLPVDAPVDIPSMDAPMVAASESSYVCEVCGLTEDMCECDISVSREGPLLGMAMEAAEHDHGHDDDAEDEGEVVDPNTYIYKPEQIPQRLSKPGDNPMVSEEVMSRYKRLVNDYVSFVAESEIPNEAGAASPLTSADREEFDRDPSADEEPKTDGTMSPMSMIKRQAVMK